MKGMEYPIGVGVGLGLTLCMHRSTATYTLRVKLKVGSVIVLHFRTHTIAAHLFLGGRSLDCAMRVRAPEQLQPECTG